MIGSVKFRFSCLEVLAMLVVNAVRRGVLSIEEALLSYWASALDENAIGELVLWLMPIVFRIKEGRVGKGKQGMKYRGYTVKPDGTIAIVAEHKVKVKSRHKGAGHGKSRKPQARNKVKPLHIRSSRSSRHIEHRDTFKGRACEQQARAERIDASVCHWAEMFATGQVADCMVRHGLVGGFWRSLYIAADKSRERRKSRAEYAIEDKQEALDLAGSRILADLQEQEDSRGLWAAITSRVAGELSRRKKGKVDVAILDLLEQGKTHKQIAGFLRQNGTRISRQAVSRRILKIQARCAYHADRLDPIRSAWHGIEEDNRQATLQAGKPVLTCLPLCDLQKLETIRMDHVAHRILEKRKMQGLQVDKVSDVGEWRKALQSVKVEVFDYSGLQVEALPRDEGEITPLGQEQVEKPDVARCWDALRNRIGFGGFSNYLPAKKPQWYEQVKQGLAQGLFSVAYFGHRPLRIPTSAIAVNPPGIEALAYTEASKQEARKKELAALADQHARRLGRERKQRSSHEFKVEYATYRPSRKPLQTE